MTESEWEGVITLDVPFWVTELEGRLKHEDPEEIGIWLAHRVRELLRSDYEDIVGAAVGEVEHVGSRNEKWRDWLPEEAGLPDLEPDERDEARFPQTMEMFGETWSELYEMFDNYGLLDDGPPDPSSFSPAQRKAIVRASDLLDEARRALRDGL